MDVTYRDFLDFAETQLACETLTQFELRNATSRAYYALYHKACDRADELNIPRMPVSDAGSHAELARRIASRGLPGRSISDQLEKLKKQRTLCDYNLQGQMQKSKALYNIAQVRDLIGKLERLS